MRKIKSPILTEIREDFFKCVLDQKLLPACVKVSLACSHAHLYYLQLLLGYVSEVE